MDEAEYHYKLVIKMCEDDLEETDVIVFLGTLLNYSVFLRDIRKDRKTALKFLKYWQSEIL